MKRQVTRCPSCHRPLQVTELTCETCGLHVTGRFERGCRFCSLGPEQRRLLDVFLSCRGVLRDMEKVLEISYPTVRGRVDGLLSDLGYAPPKAAAESKEELAARRQQILDRLESGDLPPDQAVAALKELAG